MNKENNFSSKVRNIFFSAIVLLFSMGLMLLVSELFLRNYKYGIEKVVSVHDHYQFNLDYGIEPKPNLSYIEYDVLRKTNSHAMYSPEISIEKTKKRIVFLGDSYTIGPGIKQEENYPDLVTKALNEKFGNIEYLVGANGGSSPFQQSIIFENKILKFKPDVVVYQLYENDLNEDFSFRYSGYYTQISVWEKVPDFLKRYYLVQQIALAITKYYTSKNKEYYELYKDQKLEWFWNNFTKPGLDRILEICNERGIEFYIFYIPCGYEVGNEYDNHGPGGKNYLSMVAEEWAQSNNVLYLNLFNFIIKENSSKLFEFYLPGPKGLHLTERGAKLIADQLIREISENSKNLKPDKK